MRVEHRARMFERILVAVDGSAPARRALRTALLLARDQRAMLVVLHVIDELALRTRHGNTLASYAGGFVSALRRSGRRILDRAAAQARARGVTYENVMVDSGGEAIGRAIVAQADLLGADLLVLGTHGRRGVRRLVVGSDAEHVLRTSRVPVLVVRQPDAAVRRVKPTLRPARTARRPAPPASALQPESSR
jgi:nucleotide-binding universal stress UspA family protein